MTNEVRETTAGSDETDVAPTEPDDIDEMAAEPTALDDETEPDAPAPTKRRRQGMSPVARRVAYAVLAVLVLASGGVTAWLYFKQYRPDLQTDFSVKQAVVSSASDGTTALLSYSSDTLDQDFANARSHLAGDFLSYFNDFTQQIVAPAAKQRSLKTTAHVTGAAVTELHPDWAIVLVFIDQTTTTKDNAQPSVAVSSVLVHVHLINGKWLITKFNPV